MAVTVPSTQALNDEIIADLAAVYAQSIPLLPKSFLRVIAKVLAGKIAISYRYSAFNQLQLYVAHASYEETTVRGKRIRPLVEWGRLLGEGDPLPGVRAELSVAVTVKNQTGTLRTGSMLLFEDTGVIYTSTFDVPLNAAEVTVTVRAVSDPDGNEGVGQIGNLPVDSVLSFANPLPNVGNARVLGTAIAGADAEEPEVYRARVMRRANARPQGGAYADYREWAESVEGIVRAYPYTGIVPGTVEVYVEATEASSGSPDGIPTAPQLTAVRDAINDNNVVTGKARRRPANAALLERPITRTAFTLEITALNPDTPELRAQIGTAVDEYLRTREPFIVGLSTLPRADRITGVAIGGVVEDIVSAEGGSVEQANLKLGSALITAYELGHGEKAKLTLPPTFI